VFASPNKIKLEGKIENHTIQSLKITSVNDKEIGTAELKEDGRFKMSFRTDAGYFKMKYGRNTAYLYLHAKD
jgi:hypothetical protein